MAKDLIVSIWTGLWQFLATDKATFAYGGETIKVDGLLKTLTAYREKPRLMHLILEKYPELRGVERGRTSKKHRSRKRAVIQMETKGGNDQNSSGQSYQRGLKKKKKKDRQKDQQVPLKKKSQYQNTRMEVTCQGVKRPREEEN